MSNLSIPYLIKKYIFNIPTKNTKLKLKSDFLPLEFKKANSVDYAKNYAWENFGIKNFSANKLADLNTINQICTKIFNITEGEAQFPPTVILKKQKNHGRTIGTYGDNSIELIEDNKFISTLIHEIAHYNHELFSKNYIKMGKISEIKEDMLYPDYSIFEKFSKHSDLKLIRTHLGGYATSSPCEFVAEMFMNIVNEKKLPRQLFELYKEFEGPFYEKFLKHYTSNNLFI